jgi:hypothetical protein
VDQSLRLAFRARETAVLCFERGRRVVAVAAAAVSVAIARSRGKDG